MLNEVKHAIIPVVVIICASVLLGLGRIDTSTALAMISASGAYGVVAITAGGKNAQ